MRLYLFLSVNQSFLLNYILYHLSKVFFCIFTKIKILLCSLFTFFVASPFCFLWLISRRHYFSVIGNCFISLIKFFYHYYFFFFFYKDSGIKRASFFFSSYGNEAEILALHNNGIIVDEFLHSHLHIDHFGYNLIFKDRPFSIHTSKLVPNNIFGSIIYKDFFNSTINYSVLHNSLPPVGEFNSFNYSGPLVFGQPDAQSKILQYIEDNIQFFPNGSIYKLHPRESIDRSLVKRSFHR